MTGEVATSNDQIGKDIPSWLQAWSTTNGVERRRKKPKTKNKTKTKNKKKNINSDCGSFFSPFF